MRKLENRLQLMNYFGARQLNPQWSWCGVNVAEKKVYLSVWEDQKYEAYDCDRKAYIVQEEWWGMEAGTPSPGRNDHDAKLDLVFNGGYEAFGYFIVAEDVDAQPRKIKRTKTSFVCALELERLEDSTVIGYVGERIEVK